MKFGGVTVNHHQGHVSGTGEDGDLLVSKISSKISTGIEAVTTMDLVALSKAAFGSTSNRTPSSSSSAASSAINIPYLDRHYLQQEHVECVDSNGQIITLVRYVGMVQDVSNYVSMQLLRACVYWLAYMNQCVSFS